MPPPPPHLWAPPKNFGEIDSFFKETKHFASNIEIWTNLMLKNTVILLQILKLAEEF